MKRYLRVHFRATNIATAALTGILVVPVEILPRLCAFCKVSSACKKVSTVFYKREINLCLVQELTIDLYTLCRSCRYITSPLQE